jgi:hypothetical protein
LQADNAVIYYLAGTAGWGARFDGRPTALWNGPPAITAQPFGTTTNVGTTVSLRVLASGTAPLLYQWRKAAIGLAGATNLTLTIRNVQLSDAGDYTAVVANSYGAATSQVATLTIGLARAATAVLTVVNGFVVEATLIDGGWGYTNTPLVRILGGGGSGAKAVAVVTNGIVVAVNVVGRGSGYVATPVVVIEPPFIEPPTMRIGALMFGPLVTPVVELDSANLAPYDNYQLQFSPVAGGAWTNLGIVFTPTATNDTRYVNAPYRSGFFRLHYVP